MFKIDRTQYNMAGNVFIANLRPQFSKMFLGRMNQTPPGKRLEIFHFQLCQIEFASDGPVVIMLVNRAFAISVLWVQLKAVYSTSEIVKCGFWRKLPLFGHFCRTPTQ